MPDSNGNYSVVVINQNGCLGSSSAYSYTTVNTGVNGIAAKTIRVYPNPATDIIYIRSEQMVKEISILNELGQKIIAEANPTDRVDISSLSADIYYVEVTTKDGQTSFFKMIKK